MWSTLGESWLEKAKRVSVGPRHSLVRMLAPKVYSGYLQYVKVFGDSSVARPMIRFVKSMALDDPLTGAEIGVYEADNAASILNMLNMRLLYLIDPYRDYVLGSEICRIGDSQRIAVNRLAAFNDRIRWLTMTSSEAAAHVSSGLDFVYIDGNHDYDFVKNDIVNYYDKVRPGGVFGGHDFRKEFPGVIQAACEFVVKAQEHLMVENTDWWIVKRHAQ